MPNQLAEWIRQMEGWVPEKRLAPVRDLVEDWRTGYTPRCPSRAGGGGGGGDGAAASVGTRTRNLDYGGSG
jgi:hypothetical protein